MVSTSVPAQPSPDDGVQPRNVSQLSPLLPKLLLVMVFIKVTKKLPKHLVTMSSPKALSGGSPNLTGRVPTKTFLSFRGCTHPPLRLHFLFLCLDFQLKQGSTKVLQVCKSPAGSQGQWRPNRLKPALDLDSTPAQEGLGP